MAQAGLIKPTSFGVNIVFDNEFTVSNFDIGSIAADLMLTRLPNGSVHDSDGSSQSTLVLPRKVSCWAQLLYDNPTNLGTKYKAVCDEVGKKATLTGIDISSTSWTATARLESVDADLPPYPLDTTVQLRFKMTFALLTEWS